MILATLYFGLVMVLGILFDNKLIAAIAMFCLYRLGVD